jgi:iron complex outermembrane recepter protein
MRNIAKKGLLAAGLLLGGSSGWAQTQQMDLYELSLEELMNLSIVSASKKEEKLFEAPVSSYSITRDEIRKAGVSSIPEALRLCPEMVVRETTNGNYDVHIRGLDNLARSTTSPGQVNSYTLVMINNRPVFNYNQGGTFWESLPIDLIDVERIEIVRGPAAALYGPNAVSGVINIITRELKSDDWHVAAHALYGLPGNTEVINLSAGKKINNMLGVRLSGNYQSRQRLDNQYYRFPEDQYVSSEEYVKGLPVNQGLDSRQALDKIGLNSFIDLNLSEDSKWQLSTGYSNSQAQKVTFSSTIPLTFSSMQNHYASLGGNYKGLQTRISYSGGSDELHRSSEAYTTQYDYRLIDASVDYHWQLLKNLSLRPSVNYFASTYSDLPYVDERRMDEGKWYGGLLNARQQVNSLAGSMRAEYNPTDKLRLIASARVDKFSMKDELQLSYQMAGTYSLSDKLLLRSVYSKANSGVFYSFTYVDAKVPITDQMIFAVQGNPDLALTTNRMAEIGLRAKVKENIQADLAVFNQRVHDVIFYAPVTGYLSDPQLWEITLVHEYMNMPHDVNQWGATASVNVVSNTWQIRPFVTVQKTNVSGFVEYNPYMATREVADGEHTSTPRVFGGAFMNWQPVSRLNLNLNSYFFAQHTMYALQDAFTESAGAPLSKERQVEGKLLLNLKAAYRVQEKLDVFVGGRNLLNQNTREYYGTDRMGSQLFGGLSYNF